ncbi:hypothetical protein BKA70DRAFT_1222307 [Coprinopsis sp. MPI-PUGE-AT-0042]|nr:hypothetical protein BKA70DRAFT_1222307 [Coprinopsis sp. MPI-PUGE-AT-0042]
MSRQLAGLLLDFILAFLGIVFNIRDLPSANRWLLPRKQRLRLCYPCTRLSPARVTPTYDISGQRVLARMGPFLYGGNHPIHHGQSPLERYPGFDSLNPSGTLSRISFAVRASVLKTAKKLMELIHKEHCETGGGKRSIYESYFKNSAMSNSGGERYKRVGVSLGRNAEVCVSKVDLDGSAIQIAVETTRIGSKATIANSRRTRFRGRDGGGQRRFAICDDVKGVCEGKRNAGRSKAYDARRKRRNLDNVAGKWNKKCTGSGVERLGPGTDIVESERQRYNFYAIWIGEMLTTRLKVRTVEPHQERSLPLQKRCHNGNDEHNASRECRRGRRQLDHLYISCWSLGATAAFPPAERGLEIKEAGLEVKDGIGGGGRERQDREVEDHGEQSLQQKRRSIGSKDTNVASSRRADLAELKANNPNRRSRTIGSAGYSSLSNQKHALKAQIDGFDDERREQEEDVAGEDKKRWTPVNERAARSSKLRPPSWQKAEGLANVWTRRNSEGEQSESAEDNEDDGKVTRAKTASTGDNKARAHDEARRDARKSIIDLVAGGSGDQFAGPKKGCSKQSFFEGGNERGFPLGYRRKRGNVQTFAQEDVLGDECSSKLCSSDRGEDGFNNALQVKNDNLKSSTRSERTTACNNESDRLLDPSRSAAALYLSKFPLKFIPDLIERLSLLLGARFRRSEPATSPFAFPFNPETLTPSTAYEKTQPFAVLLISCFNMPFFYT